MDARNWNQELLNQNAERDYPLANDASAYDLTGEFRLPRDFLVALHLAVNASMNISPSAFTLKTLGVYSTGVTIEIGYDTGTEVKTVATAMVPRASHTRNAEYRLGGIGDFFDLDGWLVINHFDSLDSQPAGEWQFDLAGGRLEVEAVRPQLRGVSQLRVQNGSDLSVPITGDVILRAGRNLRITPVLVTGEDPVLVFDAISGEGLNEDCICAGDVTNGIPIYTINRIRPGPDGNFTLLSNACVALTPIEHGIQVEDKCSAPCCGCKELETVTRAMEMFGQQAATLENLLTGLEARTSQMDQVVLGSRLGDRGCLSCQEE